MLFKSFHSVVIALVLTTLMLFGTVSTTQAATQITNNGDNAPTTPVQIDHTDQNTIIAPNDLPYYLVDFPGKLLFVDMSDFRIYAYEDGELIRSTIVAIGRPGAATLPGAWLIDRKYEERDLTWKNNTVEDVPYIMYYDGSFAIHGAYWHDDFGERVSSGCVNLPVDEAVWYYDFAEIGTQVVIQY